MFKNLRRKKEPERRKYRRIPLSCIIGMNMYDEKKVIQSIDSGGMSKNLSMSGILFETKEKFALNTFVKIDLDVSRTPNVKMVSVIGEVVRIEEGSKEKYCDYGIRFIKVPKKDEKALSEFISEYTNDKNGKGFMDKKRTFLFHFFSASGMSHVKKDRGWFKLPRISKRKILD